MLTISTNVPSLNAQRQLAKNSGALSKSFQRLSSGMRINTAADDAAGLAISNRMTAQIRGLNQAARNASDGISLAQTAEGALAETTSMLQRIRELAVQSANDTYTATDRAAIQAEVDQLLAEVDRIATQTEFNGRRLLDGSFNDLRLHVGAYAGQNIAYSIASARVFSLGAVAERTGAEVTAVALGEGTLTLNGVAVRGSIAQDDHLSNVGNVAASAVSKAAAINASTAAHGVVATVNANTFAVGAVTGGAVADGDLQVNGVSVGALTVVAGDADFALRNAINAISSRTGVFASVDAGALVLTAGDGRNVSVDFAGGGAAALGGAAGGVSYAQVTLQADESFTIAGAGAATLGHAEESVAVNTAVNASTVSLTSQAGANEAISLLDTAIRQVSSQQAGLGAMLSRLTAATSNLSAASENISAARGRIQDADFAAETAIFSKNQILQQASTAMLAQANVSTQIALQLIGG